VYLSPPDLDGDELERVVAAIGSNWVAPLGPEVDAFENELAAATGTSHAAALSSGTAALHLALLHHGIGHGDRVLVPTMTFAATANAVCYTGARPVFVDVDPHTANLDPASVARLLNELAPADRPKALISVDLYGQCCDYDRLEQLCEDYDLWLIEDAAEALGASWQGRLAGSFGTCGVVSFNGNKIITTSGGGMLVSDDESIVRRARHLATQARDPAAHYEHSEIGFNYRMSNVLAALGRGQLARLGAKVQRRRAIRDRYRDAFDSIGALRMLDWDPRGQPNGWLSVVVIDPSMSDRTPEDLRLALEAEDIEARPLWKPMHLQPVFRDALFGGGRHAERLFETGICLPSGSSLTEDDQERVIAVVRSCLADGTARTGLA
jgi:dTDP-4-amino-4,6-dideoxygalactose transaminase